MDANQSNEGFDKILRNESYDYLRMDPRGLGYLVLEKLAHHGKNVMQIDTITGREDTFENYRKRCIRTALHMRSKGYRLQDKITICTYNTLDSSIPFIASILTGVIPNTLDPSFSVDDFKYYLQLIKPKAIFVVPEVENSIKEAAKANNLNVEIIVFGTSFNDFLKPIDGEDTFMPFLPLSTQDTALILFSSGTTGKPKAICLNHARFYQTVSSSIYSGDKRERKLYFSSLYWISQVSLTFANITHGFIKLVYPKFDTPQAFCNIVRDYNALTTFLPPSYLLEISNYCLQNGITLSMDNIMIGGAPVLKEHLKLASKVFPTAKFINCYGQTEVGPISCFPIKQHYTKKHEEKVLNGSCGNICPGITLRIVNLDTEETMGPREEGEIRIRSHTLMNGYYGVDSSDVYDSHGWFKTGDIGYYDEDEFLYIVGRCKEMLKYKSFPVSPAILEGILLQHPAVKECIVTGIPHEVDGDHPIAFVTLKQAYNIDPNEIKKFVDDRVDDRKKLRGGVILIDKIPLSATGKPQRHLLKKMLLQDIKSQ